jgi:quercetin dioxygenase-like cupin family protein
MRRFITLLPVVVTLLGVVASGGMRTAAQEATPAAGPNFTVGSLAPVGEPFELLPGVTLEFLNEGQPAAAPGQTLVLYRVTIQPGGSGIPLHTHPGATVLTVEQGQFVWTL